MDAYVSALEKAIEQYHGQPVLQRLKDDPSQALDLSQKKIDASAFFMAMRGFSQAMHDTPPTDLISDLNAYFNLMCGIIVRHNGWIDSLIGDALFVVFGLDGGGHADDACAAALECQQALSEFNKKKKSGNAFAAGIGIASGAMTAGNVGSPHKLKFTVPGDTVNLAFRLESLTLRQQCRILISENTKNQLTVQFKLKDIGLVGITGRKEQVPILE